MTADLRPVDAEPPLLGELPTVRLRDLLGGSRRRREHALLSAGVAGVVDELPQGEDTVVGPGGVRLGPADTRRVAAARLVVQEADQPGALHTDSPPVVPPPPEDPALPGLSVLLDPVAVAPLLGRALPEGGRPDVRVRAVRYQPGRSVVVHYAVRCPRGWLTAVAFASHTTKPRRLAGARRTARATAYVAGRTLVLTPVHHVEEVGALVCWLPVDLGLPMVGLRSSKLNRRLAEAGLEPVEDAKPRLLRHWARRRAVIAFGPYVLKTYRRRKDYEQAERGLRAGAALRAVRTPAHVASLPGRRTTVQRRVKGRAAPLTPSTCAPAGRLLADLHAEDSPTVARLDHADVLAKARARAAHLAVLSPGLAPRLEALVAELEARQPATDSLVTSHGNYHAGQLLASRKSGQLVLLDLDRLCLADPGYDLACFVAQFALGRPGDADLLAEVRASLLAGYGREPETLGWYLAAALLRRGLVPFRRQLPGWADATERLVALAENELAESELAEETGR